VFRYHAAIGFNHESSVRDHLHHCAADVLMHFLNLFVVFVSIFWVTLKNRIKAGLKMAPPALYHLVYGLACLMWSLF